MDNTPSHDAVSFRTALPGDVAALPPVARRIFTVPEDRQLTVMMSQSMGVLLVTTEPSGSTVTVDGKQYGATPLTVRLPAGPHQLVVSNGAGRHEENVQIENDQFTTRSFRWQ